MFRDYLCAIEFPPVRSIREEPNAAESVLGGSGDVDIPMTCFDNADPIFDGGALVEHMHDNPRENNINTPSQRYINAAISDHATPVQDDLPFPEDLSQGELYNAILLV